MKTSDVLRAAGDLLRERGWCQNAFDDETGAVCAYGAVREATRDSFDGAWTRFVEEFDIIVGTPTVYMPAWNDARERTADEVLIAMDAAYVLRLQVEGVEPEDVL